MVKKYTQEELWEIYKTLPEKLKEKIFSAETADEIFLICTKHGVQGSKKISGVAECVGEVLLGLQEPSKFGEALQEKVGLEKETAIKIAKDISSKVFAEVEEELKKLYKIETPLSQVKTQPPSPPKRDIYREPIE